MSFPIFSFISGFISCFLICWGIYWSLSKHNKTENNDHEDTPEVTTLDLENKSKKMDTLEMRIAYLEGRFQERDFLESIRIKKKCTEDKK